MPPPPGSSLLPAPDSAPGAPSAPTFPTSDDVLPVTVATRARFAAVAAVAGPWSAAMGAGQILTHRRLARRSARDGAALGPAAAANFKRWGERWARPILAALGARIHTDDRSGLSPDAPGPVVFVANHQTVLDALVVALALPRPFAFVAKAQLDALPVVGATLRHSPSILVDKSDARRAVQSLRDAAARIAAGTSVLLFAEGIRSYHGGLRPFERGAFALAVESGVPLVPVTLCGVYRLLDERRYVARPGTALVRVHRPVETRARTRRDLPDLMAAVRQTMLDDLAAYEAWHPAGVCGPAA